MFIVEHIGNEMKLKKEENFFLLCTLPRCCSETQRQLICPPPLLSLTTLC